MASIGPQLERQVEIIHNLVESYFGIVCKDMRNLVESYFGIVCKDVRDVVPKTIMFMMVNTLKDFLKSDLLPMIYSAGDQDEMMDESQQAAKKREVIHMYKTCKDALHLISNVNSKMSELCMREGGSGWESGGRWE